MSLGRAVVIALGAAAAGCTVGEGSGWVRSERLYIEDCWDGPLDLHPDFFAANPFMQETLLIRLQRGDNIEEQSDGTTVLVNDLAQLRKRLGEALPVGLPAGVSPPGVPVKENPDPPQVSLAVYLNASCHAFNAIVYSISGEITFDSLFSGDVNEDRAQDRLTEAHFSAQFADPRQLTASADPGRDVSSTVEGYFSFYFQRGQPAQPFP